MISTITGSLQQEPEIQLTHRLREHTILPTATPTTTRTVHVVEEDQNVPEYYNNIHWQALDHFVDVEFRFYTENYYNPSSATAHWPDSYFPPDHPNHYAADFTSLFFPAGRGMESVYSPYGRKIPSPSFPDQDPSPWDSTLGNGLPKSFGIERRHNGLGDYIENQVTVEFKDNSGNVLYTMLVWDPPVQATQDWEEGPTSEPRQYIFQYINGTIYVDGQAVVVYDTVAQDWVSA